MDSSPYPIWDDWNANQRDLFITDKIGNIIFSENITSGIPSNINEVILSSLLLIDASNEATVFSLKQNFPNPFNGQTNIEFTIQNPNNISIEIFDVNGRIIRTLFDGYHNSGTSVLKWDGKNKLNEIVSTGIYFYNIKTENYIKTKKLIFSK